MTNVFQTLCLPGNTLMLQITCMFFSKHRNNNIGTCFPNFNLVIFSARDTGLVDTVSVRKYLDAIKYLYSFTGIPHAFLKP